MRALPWWQDWLAWVLAWALAVVVLWPRDAAAALCVHSDMSGNLVFSNPQPSDVTQCMALVPSGAEWGAQVSQGLELVGVNAPDILYVFSWAFGVVILFWSLGWAVGVGVSMLKKL